MPLGYCYDDLKKPEKFLGKGGFGGVYRVKVGNTWEAWKFVTIDTDAGSIFKSEKKIGFDGKQWNKNHIHSRMKEMRGMNYHSQLKHPHIA